MSSLQAPDPGAGPLADHSQLTQPESSNNTCIHAGAVGCLRSSDLLAGATSVAIEHLGQIYRLQSTRAGKLILTK